MSRQQRGERRKGGTQGQGERLRGGCYGEGAMGEDGREEERIKTWGSFVQQATESPLVSATRVREARAVGLVAVSRLACTRIVFEAISYLNTLFRQGGGGLKETEPI